MYEVSYKNIKSVARHAFATILLLYAISKLSFRIERNNVTLVFSDGV